MDKEKKNLWYQLWNKNYNASPAWSKRWENSTVRVKSYHQNQKKQPLSWAKYKSSLQIIAWSHKLNIGIWLPQAGVQNTWQPPPPPHITNWTSCNQTHHDSTYTVQHHGQCTAIRTFWSPLPQTSNIVNTEHNQIVTAILNLFSMLWFIWVNYSKCA